MKLHSKTYRLLPAELAVLIGMILALTVCFSGVVAQGESISDQVLRLHILANSDSEQDQQLKLQVRDAILNQFQLDQVGDLEQAKQQASVHLEEIEQIASDVVEQQGYSYPVKAEMVNMFFDTRQYDGFTMPAGRYDAVRITIGQAQGHNWWCVLYPPLCIPAAEPEQQLDQVLSESECELVESGAKYDVRFAVVELWESIKNYFSAG